MQDWLPRTERALRPGDRLGKYQIVSQLGTGGMAEIHLARVGSAADAPLVVIKRLHPHYACDDELVRMFMDEGTISSQFDHPNIGAVTGVASHDGVLFMVMEYIKGKDMLRTFKKLRGAGRSFPVRHAIYVLAQIARALDYVHELRDSSGRALGIVHRDISTSNIMIGFDGRPKLIDFGIATSAQRTTTSDASLRKGKARFMSPEQVLGHGVDRRSDVWALGVVLYEILAGRVLFRGTDYIDSLRRVLKQPIPRLQLACGPVPMGLEAVIRRALTRDPDNRYATAGEFAAALEQVAFDNCLESSAAEVAAMMAELYAQRRRPPRATAPTRYRFGDTVRHARRRSRVDWCPDTHELSDFLDGALGGA